MKSKIKINKPIEVSNVTIEKPVMTSQEASDKLYLKEVKAPPVLYPLFEDFKKSPQVNPKTLKVIMSKLRSDNLMDVHDATRCIELIFTKLFPNMKGWQ